MSPWRPHNTYFAAGNDLSYSVEQLQRAIQPIIEASFLAVLDDMVF